MKGIIVILVSLFVSSARAQTSVTLGTGASAVLTEGTDFVINVECSIGGAISSEFRVPLEIDTTSTVEEGYDVPTISAYTCTIPATMTTGTVDIPLSDDLAIELVDEQLALKSVTNADVTPANTFSFTIVDDETSASTKAVATPRRTVYTVDEGVGTVNIWFEFVDPNNDRIPLEETLGVAITTPTISSETAMNGVDFTFASSATFTASSGGVGVTSASIEITILDETTVENLENVNFLFAEMTAVDSVTLTSTVELRIRDDDRPEFMVISNRTPLPRRSKKDVFLWAFVNDPSTVSSMLDFTWLPWNLQFYEATTVIVNGKAVSQARIPRPRRNSRTRFNEYKFTLDQTINGNVYTQTAYTYVTPTSSVGTNAPIETGTRSTITVFPDGAVCSALDGSYDITIPLGPTNGRLRWDFIPDGSTRRRRLSLLNSRNVLSLSTCDVGGLYIVFRKDRKKLGWAQYIRVIVSACPREMAGSLCATGPMTCKNGGLVDTDLELCSCPPGFAGDTCEIALNPGYFGSNEDFNIRDFPVTTRLGKCLTFSIAGPIGTTCAAGFGGNDCCEPCVTGTFGANCAQTCNCIAGGPCDRFSGECRNGCALGFAGRNCQQLDS
ncbi:uncharacterized protein [Apostichopus japonicus]|uniref:uncharacterized protein n=1 Tax=Stichopus japonicus TaxID=307972 RepID=UPI003AB52F6D